MPLQFTEGRNPVTKMPKYTSNPMIKAKHNEMKDICKRYDNKIAKIKDDYKGTRVTAYRHLAQMEWIARRYKKNGSEYEVATFYERRDIFIDYLIKECVKI